MSLVIYTMAQHAWQHEANYIEINRWTMTRTELMAALASLLCISRAIEEAGHEWRERKCTTITATRNQ
jgi:hypothetical protein